MQASCINMRLNTGIIQFIIKVGSDLLDQEKNLKIGACYVSFLYQLSKTVQVTIAKGTKNSDKWPNMHPEEPSRWLPKNLFLN